ncbi:unnamed protein product [Allacma fusca]|uniref:Peptide transporter n=1 Tax=Allacma fusca TaxID=39272 RepID=A0A8J2NTU4_9HEXA|nr:unnamed protein product [Allacma fusca]
MEKVDEPNKLKYPVGVFFIVYNGLSDRFAYYGIKAVLILYLTKMLLFEEDKAKETYHLFFMFCTLIPVFGASIADSFVGKFKTILIFTVIYIVGNAILVVAAIPPLQLPQT